MRGYAPAVLLCLFPISSSTSSATPEEEEAKKITWTLSGEARLRPEWRENADLDSREDDDLRQGFMRLRLGLAVQIRDTFKLFAQAQDSRVAGEESSTTSDEENLDLHQGYLEFKPVRKSRLTLTAGRQELKYGDERMIGAFGWDNVGRSFDGLKTRYARENLFVDGMVARVVNRNDGSSTSGSDLAGVYAQSAFRPGSEYEGYLLAFFDNIDAAGELGAPGETSIYALGGRVKDRFARVDINAEAVIQSGEFHGEDHAAWSAALQAGGNWGDAWKVRPFIGYDFATGDDDPVDGDRQEFFNFFPTNHPHYGYADYEGWRNIRSPYAGISLAHTRYFVQVKAHRFMLEEEAGPWKDAGGNVMGFDPAGASGINVGREFDLTGRFTWQEKTALEAGFARFEPGQFARRTRGDDPSHWAYLTLTVGF